MQHSAHHLMFKKAKNDIKTFKNRKSMMLGYLENGMKDENAMVFECPDFVIHPDFVIAFQTAIHSGGGGVLVNGDQVVAVPPAVVTATKTPQKIKTAPPQKKRHKYQMTKKNTATKKQKTAATIPNTKTKTNGMY